MCQFSTARFEFSVEVLPKYYPYTDLVTKGETFCRPSNNDVSLLLYTSSVAIIEVISYEGTWRRYTTVAVDSYAAAEA